MMVEQIKNNYKRKIIKGIKRGIFLILKELWVPIAIILIIFILICYIADIFYLGIHNEEKSNLKQELKYYTSREYTEDEGKEFLSSIKYFISGIFGGEFVDDADWPVLGHTVITSKFGYRNAPTAGASTFHRGIDIGAPKGSKLVAIADGIVTRAGWGGASGYIIEIKTNDYIYSYSHTDPEFVVRVGEQVKKGQIVGKVGPKNVYGIRNNPYRDANGNPTNGATTGPHCHFSVKMNGEFIDPLIILNKGGIA